MKISGSGQCADCATPQIASPAERAKAAVASTRSKAELTVYTAEGDKVTLSATYTQEAGRFEYGPRRGSAPVNGEARTSGSLRYAAQNASVDVAVEGDLSADEVADIQKLARILSRATGQAARGNTDRAAQTASRALKLDSVSSFDYSFSASAEYSYASTRSTKALSYYTPPQYSLGDAKPPVEEVSTEVVKPEVEQPVLEKQPVLLKPPALRKPPQSLSVSA